MLLHGPGGIRIVPAASGTQAMVNLTPAPARRSDPGLQRHQRKLDVLIVDTAAGIGDQVVSFVRAAQEVLVVVCDEPTPSPMPTP